MSKRIIAGVLTVLIAAALCTACADSGGTATAEPSVSGNTDYAAWTWEDWEAASSAQQQDCAYYVFLQVGDLMVDNFDEMVEEAKTDAAAEEKISSATEELADSIGPYLEQNPQTTVGDLIDSTRSVLEAALNQQ